MKNIRADFSQPMHCCGPIGSDDTASLSVSIQDGGGGEYVVLNAVEWSLDDVAQIEELAEHLKAMLTRCVVEP